MNSEPSSAGTFATGSVFQNPFMRLYFTRTGLSARPISTADTSTSLPDNTVISPGTTNKLASWSRAADRWGANTRSPASSKTAGLIANRTRMNRRAP